MFLFWFGPDESQYSNCKFFYPVTSNIFAFWIENLCYYWQAVVCFRWRRPLKTFHMCYYLSFLMQGLKRMADRDKIYRRSLAQIPRKLTLNNNSLQSKKIFCFLISFHFMPTRLCLCLYFSFALRNVSVHITNNMKKEKLHEDKTNLSFQYNIIITILHYYNTFFLL